MQCLQVDAYDGAVLERRVGIAQAPIVSLTEALSGRELHRLSHNRFVLARRVLLLTKGFPFPVLFDTVTRACKPVIQKERPYGIGWVSWSVDWPICWNVSKEMLRLQVKVTTMASQAAIADDRKLSDAIAG